MSLPTATIANSRNEIRALTGVRGVAALIVMAFHYWYRDWVPRTTFSGHIAARGYISVDLFFILSGFVMCKAYGIRFLGDFDVGSYLRFLGRRLARIYPIYGVLLGVGVVASMIRPAYFPPLTIANVLLNVALIQTWVGHLSIIGTAWSLSTEWGAYLAFPALVWLVLRSRPSIAIATCLAAAGLIVLVWGYEVSLGQSPALGLDEAGGLVTPLGRCAGGFVLGMGLCRLAGSSVAEQAGADWFGIAVIAALAVFWVMPGTPDLLLYACLPALILCLALNRGRVSAVFASKPVWLLGEWSYSIYLIHMFVIHLRQHMFDFLVKHMPAPLADMLGATVFYGLTIGAAALCFTMVEVPARRFLVRRIALSVHAPATPAAGLAATP
jgi:peptidoglycan/LPS O-acetylase OafA/YrhL